MLETLHITETVAQLTAVIPVTVPRAEIGEVMGPGITELKPESSPDPAAWRTELNMSLLG